jgi:TonB family protein
MRKVEVKLLVVLSIISLLTTPLSHAQRRRSQRKIKKPQINLSQAASKDCISDEEIEGCTIDPSAPEPELGIPFSKIRCSDCIIYGKPLEKPAPCYPQLAKAANVLGEVQVKMVVDEKGKVIWAKAISGHPLLHRAAVRAACSTRFSPSYVIGRKMKVKTVGLITYNFKLS